MRTDTIKGADLVRVIACSAVFMHHLAFSVRKPDLPGAVSVFLDWSDKGKFGVSVFFVLSGFLLGLPFWKKSDAGRDFEMRYYAIMRIARIAPATWLCLIISLAVDIFYFERFDSYTAYRFLSGLAFVSDWHWLTFFPVDANGPLWSLSFEVSSYIFMPVAFVAIRAIAPAVLHGWRGRYVWSLVILSALTLHGVAFELLPKAEMANASSFGVRATAVSWFPTYNPFGFFAMFAIGTLAAGVQTAIPNNARYPAICHALFVVGAGTLAPVIVFKLIALLYAVPEPPFAFPALPIAVAMFLVVVQHVNLGWLIDNKPVATFARLSFGVYIWHQLVLIFVTAAVDTLLVASIERVALIAIISFLTTCALASVSYRYFEEPLLERARVWSRAPG